MHRELSHITTLAAPLELKGRTVKKTGQENKSSLGKWENLITISSVPPMSPRSVKNRCQESDHAKRTLQPELNKDLHLNKTRKIAEKEGGPEAGSLLRLFRKSGTVEEVHKSKKKFFKELIQTEDMIDTKPEKKMYRPHSRKQDDLRTHISTLSSPINTYKAETRVETPSSPTKRKRQDFLKSAISVLPCGENTKRPFQDRDEAQIIQSATSPKMMRHLSSTYLHEPLHVTTNKRNPNHESSQSYETQSRLNPMTKGKKGAPPKIEINTNAAFQPIGAPSTYSPRYGGTEPLDVMYQGQRHVVPRTPTSTIISPSSEQTAPRGQTVFSYRTFASQIF